MYDLPTPQLVAEYPSNVRVDEASSVILPETHLFVKPRFGRSGKSVEMLRWIGDCFQSDRGYRLSSTGASKHLARRAADENKTLLVQPALVNHPALRTRPNEALAPVRLVTGISSTTVVVPIFAFIYFPQPDHLTAEHGYLALIDTLTGRLSALPRSMSAGEKPPPERSVAETWTIPNWKDALHYAKTAHAICSNVVFIGWDIAFTDQGPMLLEGNANWSADEFQSLTGNPLGATKFSEVLESQIRHRGVYTT